MPWACGSRTPCKCCYYTIGTKEEDGTLSTGWHMNAVGEWHWWHGDAPHCSARALEEMTWTRRLIRIFTGPVEPACSCCYYSYAQGWPPKCGWFVGEWSDQCRSFTWTWSHYEAPHYRWPWRVPRSHIVGTWAEYLFPPGGPDPTEAEYKEICEMGWREQWPSEDDDDSDGSGSGIHIEYRVDLQVQLPGGPGGPGGPGRAPIAAPELPGGPGGPGGPGRAPIAAQAWLQNYLNEIAPPRAAVEAPVDMSAAAWIAARSDYRENAVQQGDEDLQRIYRDLEENPLWVALHGNPGPAGHENPQGPEERFEDMIIVGLQGLEPVPEEEGENMYALEYR